MAFKIDEDIVERHLRKILNSYYDDVFETSEYYNVRCNVCGDSEKDIYKKRGFLLKTRDPWVYYCHNCHTSTSVISWMKEHYTGYYKDMILEVMQNKSNSNDDGYSFKQKKSAVERDEKEDTEGFKPLTQFDDCVEYCESRRIPREIYRRWFYATKGIYKGRIMIMFRKPNGKIHYYQGRSFNNKGGVKYLSRFGDHISIYNYYNVDPEKPVPMLEGPIDSDFVENAIAVTGLKLKDEALDRFKRLYFMLDNDDSANKKVHKLLKEKRYVFNWSKFLKKYRCVGEVKDVNDFILKNVDGITKLTWKMIEPYFTNNPMDKIYFIIKKKK